MTIAHQLIAAHYASKQTARSKVPLINHINEGIKILEWLGEPEYVKDAFCLHPMLQDDRELAANWSQVVDAMSTQDNGAKIIMLAMEYRSVANEFLRDKVSTMTVDAIRLSPISAVNNMLIADKIQNRKDFEIYHKGTHPNTVELEQYFPMWLERLSVSEEMYQTYVKQLTE